MISELGCKNLLKTCSINLKAAMLRHANLKECDPVIRATAFVHRAPIFRNDSTLKIVFYLAMFEWEFMYSPSTEKTIDLNVMV